VSDLAAFLAARLDEDEAEALANIGAGPGWQRGLGDDARGTGPMWPDYQTYGSEELSAAEAYLKRFRPLRALREVEAMRAILAEHGPARGGRDADRCRVCTAIADSGATRFRAPCPTLVFLAAIWADHPDFDPSWARGKEGGNA
jgi:hypothetical protein